MPIEQTPADFDAEKELRKIELERRLDELHDKIFQKQWEIDYWREEVMALDTLEQISDIQKAIDTLRELLKKAEQLKFRSGYGFLGEEDKKEIDGNIDEIRENLALSEKERGSLIGTFDVTKWQFAKTDPRQKLLEAERECRELETKEKELSEEFKNLQP